MGDVIDLAVERAKPRFRFVAGDSIGITTTSGPVEIHCYSYWQGASVVLDLLSGGAVFATDSVTLKLVARPPPLEPEPPKPPELMVNREFSPRSRWRRILDLLRPRPRLLRK